VITIGVIYLFKNIPPTPKRFFMKTKLTLCFVFVVCANIHTANAQVNVQDSLALVDLYNSTNGQNWSCIHTNWLTKKPVSTWEGITVTNRRVTAIRMCGLEGHIPSSIGNLTNLRTLDLSLSYGLSGNIPVEIGKLRKLNYLDLSYNLLSNIPSSIGNLVNLTHLSLSNNQFSGNIPFGIGNLMNLRYLNLNSNQFTNIPSFIGNLVNLIFLDLSGNQLKGNIPASIGKLVDLRNLNLQRNQLSGNIPSSIGNLINLKNLDLWYNGFTNIPSCIGNLVNLQYLSISDNQLIGSIPSSIGKLVNLTDLYLYNNHLSGSIPSSIGNLVKLKYLYLYNNQLSGSIPSSIGNLYKLWFLELDNNKLTGSIPSSIGNLNVYGLDLSNNRLSGSIPSSIGNVGNGTLYVLNLSSNKLTGNIPASMGNLGGWLAYLLLRNNRLSGSIPSSLSNVGVDQIVGPGGETGLMTIDSNNLTFEGMEFLVQKIHAVVYSPQKNIPVHQNGNTLSVSAGGTLSNNTYKLLKWESRTTYKLVATNQGDSVFHPAVSGIYQVKILNSVATGLVLYSKVIHYIAPANPVITSTDNALQQDSKANVFRAYPNPATDELHVQMKEGTVSLINQAGKILVTKTIHVTGMIHVTSLPSGLYYLKNMQTGEVKKVVISR